MKKFIHVKTGFGLKRALQIIGSGTGVVFLDNNEINLTEPINIDGGGNYMIDGKIMKEFK